VNVEGGGRRMVFPSESIEVVREGVDGLEGKDGLWWW